MAKDRTPDAARTSPACPICGRPAAARFRPFCSSRCAELDLGRWLTGAYAVPSREEVPDDDAGDGG